MSRIQPIDQAGASAATAELLGAVKAQMGGVPNVLATMARSRAALAGYLGLSGALGDGILSAALREQIALAVAGANRCDYCASAHSALGRMAGLSADEMARNLAGEASDADAAAVLRFARRIVDSRGNVTDAELAALREAGFSDEAAIEILAAVVANIFTNYLNHLAGTEIDFPEVRTADAAAA